MPTNLAPVDVVNIALSKIGAAAINSLLDTSNPSSVIANQNWQLSYLEVSRASRWNCLMTTAILTAIPQTPLPGTPPLAPAPNWAPNTAYVANTYLSYGGYVYIVMFNYTSSAIFTNDLTTGALTQTNQPSGSPFFPVIDGSQYPSGWAYEYALPSDYQLLVSLNNNTAWNWGTVSGPDGDSDDYEIMGSSLFCDAAQAVIQYVQSTIDTTKFDSMFTNCVALKLASMISTPLRQDGGKMEAMLLGEYQRALKEARTKNGGEQQVRRFNPIQSSLFNAARYGGTNG